jgi:hypothetical protein
MDVIGRFLDEHLPLTHESAEWLGEPDPLPSSQLFIEMGERPDSEFDVRF